jgi:hypothetical protein
MAELKDLGGAAVATVTVPAHKTEVVIARSSIEGCAVAAVEAWNKVKGKDDATFEAAAPDFKQHLINHAESVYRTGKTMDGDTMLARFEHEVARIKDRQREAKEKAKAAEEAN